MTRISREQLWIEERELEAVEYLRVACARATELLDAGAFLDLGATASTLFGRHIASRGGRALIPALAFLGRHLTNCQVARRDLLAHLLEPLATLLVLALTANLGHVNGLPAGACHQPERVGGGRVIGPLPVLDQRREDAAPARKLSGEISRRMNSS